MGIGVEVMKIPSPMYEESGTLYTRPSRIERLLIPIRVERNS